MSNLNIGNPVIRFILAGLLLLVGLWVFFSIILPTIKFLVSAIISLLILGGLVWLVYKVLAYDPDKSS